MMAWTLLAAGLCTLIPGTGGVHLGLVALFVYLFAGRSTSIILRIKS